MARVAYFVRGSGASWALVRLTGRDREEIVVDGLSRDAAATGTRNAPKQERPCPSTAPEQGESASVSS